MTAIFVLIVIGTDGFIPHVIAHLRAGSRLNAGSFRYSAYCQIISFILGIFSMSLLFGNFEALYRIMGSAAGAPEAILDFMGIIGIMVALLVIGVLILLIGYISTIMGFFSIGEKQTF